jgi:hypothetical protein
MADESQTGRPDAARTSKSAALPLSTWFNVALSFVFVVLGVTFVLWQAFWQFGRELVGEDSIATVRWVILAIGVVLGLINAFRYYSRTKARLSSKS